MKKILIADASKASLVMTSEVFKDHFPGVQVVVARTSAECLELVKTTENIDAYVIDFDLPDRDGAWTAARVKKHTQTPVLITAFDRPDVHDVIEEELAAYDDCLSWLRKPVKAEVVVSVAQRFCEGLYRTQRRLACAIPALAEVVLTTTVRRTIKETVKVPLAPPKAPVAKAVAKSAPKTKAGAKGKASARAPVKAKPAKATAKASVKATAKAAPVKMTTKVVTRSITEKVKTKALVPATVTDTSLGGVKVELDFSGWNPKGKTTGSAGEVSWSIACGEILAVHIPSHESLETGDMAKWKAWQSSLLGSNVGNPDKGAAAKTVSKGATVPAAKSTLSTLAKSTKTATAKGTGAKPVESSAQTLRGRICWSQETGAVLAVGLELDNTTQAKRLFDAAHARYAASRQGTHGNNGSAKSDAHANVTYTGMSVASLSASRVRRDA